MGEQQPNEQGRPAAEQGPGRDGPGEQGPRLGEQAPEVARPRRSPLAIAAAAAVALVLGGLGGFAVAASVLGDGEGEAAAPTTTTTTAATVPTGGGGDGADGGERIVPPVCVRAVELAEDAVLILGAALSGVRDLQADQLEQAVARLDGLRTDLLTAAEDCRAALPR